MAKAKPYSDQIVKEEYSKLSNEQMIEEFNALGVWIHNLLVDGQKVLGDQLNDIEVLKKKLNGVK